MMANEATPRVCDHEHPWDRQIHTHSANAKHRVCRKMEGIWVYIERPEPEPKPEARVCEHPHPSYGTRYTHPASFSTIRTCRKVDGVWVYIDRSEPEPVPEQAAAHVCDRVHPSYRTFYTHSPDVSGERRTCRKFDGVWAYVEYPPQAKPVPEPEPEPEDFPRFDADRYRAHLTERLERYNRTAQTYHERFRTTGQLTHYSTWQRHMHMARGVQYALDALRYEIAQQGREAGL